MSKIIAHQTTILKVKKSVEVLILVKKLYSTYLVTQFLEASSTESLGLLVLVPTQGKDQQYFD
jgi:hypothetical protein